MSSFSSAEGHVPMSDERTAPSLAAIRPARASGANKVERRLALIVATLGFLLLVGLTAHHPIRSSAIQTSTAVTASESAGLGGSEVPAATPVATATTSSTPASTSSDPGPSTSPGPTRAGGDGFSLDPKQWVIDALGAAF